MGEILINQLFAGSYLQEGTNIGHEVINLFKDDNNDNYVYVTPSGSVGDHSVDRILFVQNIKARETMEVVMKAEGLAGITNDETRNIYYAGVNIADIFNKNVYHGIENSSTTEVSVTYKAEKVSFPKKNRRIIITVDVDFVAEDDNTEVVLLDPDKNRIVGQGMRTYLSDESYPVMYEKVKNLLDDDSLWEQQDESNNMSLDGYHRGSGISFLEIIRKENDELIMSNLLAYYFNYNHSMFAKFVDEILGINDFSTSFEIIRESQNNIDLWIRDANHIIVIENKIKSGINGKHDDGTTQLNKYYEYTEKIKEEAGVEEACYYIFAPNYNDITIDETVSNIYKIIYYSDIYDFFRRNAAEFINDKYFSDFLGGLKNQTMTYSELRFSIMRSRFLEKINQN